MRVVGYVRVSTEEQSSQGVSLDAQRERLTAYAKLYDLELVTVVEDAGVSGKTLNRPGLSRALDVIRSGGADGLLIAKLDRLSRNVADFASLIEDYFGERAGKRLFSVADQVDTRTAGGRLVLNVLMSVSAWEREAISERTATALRHKRSHAEVYGGIPFGYRRTDDDRLEPVQEELATLERARQLHAAGMSMRKIAITLAAEGRKTKNGGRWHGVTVAGILNRGPVGDAHAS